MVAAHWLYFISAMSRNIEYRFSTLKSRKVLKESEKKSVSLMCLASEEEEEEEGRRGGGDDDKEEEGEEGEEGKPVRSASGLRKKERERERERGSVGDRSSFVARPNLQHKNPIPLRRDLMSMVLMTDVATVPRRGSDSYQSLNTTDTASDMPEKESVASLSASQTHDMTHRLYSE